MAIIQRSSKVSLAIISYTSLCLIGGCFGSEHCYRVVDRYVCYFVPYGARSIGEEWQKAAEVCRDNAATLPIVENKDGSGAGREVHDDTATWSGFMDSWKRSTEQQVALAEWQRTTTDTSDVSVKRGYRLRDGCLKAVTRDTLRWYDARNLCIENGGDLPIFENPALINVTHEVFNQLTDAIGIWIGLRRTWWNWQRSSGSLEEIRYTNWLERDSYLNRECMLLTQNGKRWKQQFCMAAKRFFCQTIKTDLYSVQALKLEAKDADAEYPHKMMIVVGVSIPLVILVSVASVLFVSKCKVCLRSSDRPKPPDQQPRMNGQTPVASNTHYTDLRPLESNIKVQQIELQQRQQHALQEYVWVSREPLDT